MIMLLRHTRAVATVGMCARHSFAPSVPLSTVCFAREFQRPTIAIHAQRRLKPSAAAYSTDDSGKESPPVPIRYVSVLPAPFQLGDLNRDEQQAYQTYGPRYLEHLEQDAREEAEKRVSHRLKTARLCERDIGSHWYPALKLYDEARTKRYAAFELEIQRNASEMDRALKSGDLTGKQKKALKRKKDKSHKILRKRFLHFRKKHRETDWEEVKQIAEELRLEESRQQ